MHRFEKWYGFQELLSIKIIAGRGFTENREMESQRKEIINRAPVETFGLDMKSAAGQKYIVNFRGKIRF